MGRKRQYATVAQRQAAYRQRMHDTTVWVDRDQLARIESAIATLQDATWRALNQGNRVAGDLYRSSPLDTLEATVAWIIQHLHKDRVEK